MHSPKQCLQICFYKIFLSQSPREVAQKGPIWGIHYLNPSGPLSFIDKHQTIIYEEAW